ncbi:hypothetical protein BKA70DRAFT_640553 [Coprinopsis sp. MPI-PUGE-AT-0042]|nr:hypothetical protein BKA70DRAFT_640553 [Coprinopsis sp. MPI-PUGE-AT-0042]
MLKTLRHVLVILCLACWTSSLFHYFRMRRPQDLCQMVTFRIWPTLPSLPVRRPASRLVKVRLDTTQVQPQNRANAEYWIRTSLLSRMPNNSAIVVMNNSRGGRESSAGRPIASYSR